MYYKYQSLRYTYSRMGINLKMEDTQFSLYFPTFQLSTPCMHKSSIICNLVNVLFKRF